MKEKIWQIIENETDIRGIELSTYKRNFEYTLDKLMKYIKEREERAFDAGGKTTDYSFEFDINFFYSTFEDYLNSEEYKNDN